MARGNVEQQENFFHLQSKGYEHPIVSIWKDPASGNPATANFYRAFGLEVEKTDVPKAGVGAPAVVLNYDDGTPAVMERTWGYGRVIQFSSTADSAWNDLCIRPIFVPLIHRILGSVVTRQDEHLNLRVGTKLSLVVNGDLVGKDVRIGTPGGKKEAMRLQRIALSGGLPLLEFDETESGGVYPVYLGDDATAMIQFAAQSEASESKLAELSGADWKVFDGVAKVIRWTPAENLRFLLEKERTGTEYWLGLAILGLLLAMMEMWLGNRWSVSK